ncbi:uncharacterized protein EV420DRAFT_523126 [Desarmillaria tabescens]|uniref:Uncharacterized protein n=1 Tax=Armillaria tabescens TaxID=1929756 RepID=A0AA39KA29_ARMTA|nr:uncharacterized protein EV420DRAFT_523126 [Desarmillaria tabescens]KAK0457371.1 hypothetical protein EV420DRAFT_523126 [Desarmillaria tabescens]
MAKSGCHTYYVSRRFAIFPKKAAGRKFILLRVYVSSSRITQQLRHAPDDREKQSRYHSHRQLSYLGASDRSARPCVNGHCSLGSLETTGSSACYVPLKHCPPCAVKLSIVVHGRFAPHASGLHSVGTTFQLYQILHCLSYLPLNSIIPSKRCGMGTVNSSSSRLVRAKRFSAEFVLEDIVVLVRGYSADTTVSHDGPMI